MKQIQIQARSASGRNEHRGSGRRPQHWNTLRARGQRLRGQAERDFLQVGGEAVLEEPAVGEWVVWRDIDHGMSFLVAGQFWRGAVKEVLSAG